MKIILLTLIITYTVCYGAMEDQQICIEQSNLTTQGPDRNGVNIWLPCGSAPNTYILHILSPHNGTKDGVDCWEHGMTYVAKCVAGEYIPALVGESELSFPSGNWSSGSEIVTTSPEGWRYISNGSIEERNMRLTVPSNTTRLYMIPYTSASCGTLIISQVSGSGTIVKSNWNLDLDTTTLDVDNSGGPKYTGMYLIATDCGGDVYDFIGDSGDAIGVCGFVCVKDNGSLDEYNPYDGVFDPETITEVMLYEFGGLHQTAEGPLSLNNSSGWWGNGHWDPNDTLINESQTLYYQDATTGVWVNWTTVNTVDRHIRKKAKAFSRVLTGNIQINLSGINYTVGDHQAVYSFGPTGLTITLDHLFNATAATQGLEYRGFGGYSGQWTLVKGFAKSIKTLPTGEVYTINTGNFTNNTSPHSAKSGYILAFGNQYEAIMQNTGILISSNICKSGQFYALVERNDIHPKDANPEEIKHQEGIKIYFMNKDVSAPLAIADGDRVGGKHTRIVTSKGLSGSFPIPTEICPEPPFMDSNGDCKVDFADFCEFALEWMSCGLENQSNCRE